MQKTESLTNICLRCGYNWLSRSLSKKPVQCPKCKSRYWDEERKKAQNKKLK